MNIILLGAPGVGKGTQARFLANIYHIPLIATGEIFRNAVENKTSLGVMAKSYMDKGALVPDNIVIDLVVERLQKADCLAGYILDGFPRTIPQAVALKNADVKIDCVIEIAANDAEIIHRLSGRRVHIASGRIYHVDYNPPLVHDRDDVTNELLVLREDDKAETVKKRLEVYHSQTKPLIEYYENHENFSGKYVRVDGIGAIDDVQKRILTALI